VSAWQTVGGLTKAHFPLAGPDWIGPEAPEARLSDDDDVKAIRGVFTRPDGSKRMAEVVYLKASKKHRFYSVQS
jgi:hypothetical protein